MKIRNHRSVLKSFFWSWRLTSFMEAWTLPCVVTLSCRKFSLSGQIRRKDKHSRLYIGFGEVSTHCLEKSIVEVKGVIEINGTVRLGPGTRLTVGPTAHLSFGNNVSVSAGATIICHDAMTIGDCTIISWDTLIMDTDFHQTIDLDLNQVSIVSMPIMICENTWICAKSTILKGSIIPPGCIVGANSLVNSKFAESDCIIAGNPANVVKHGVTRNFL